MKKQVILFASLCFVLAAVAQKKYEKIVYKDVTGDGEGYSIVGKDAYSNKEMTKFKIKITNKSDDVILFKPDQSALRINGVPTKPKEKEMEIGPGETDAKVINFIGPNFMVNSYSYMMDGIYRVSTTVGAVETPDFQLPPSQNEFKTGNFTCTMVDLSKETDQTAVKFECRYTGSKIGVIHPGRAAVKLPDGTEVANAKSTTHPVLLRQGESRKITLRWDRMEGGKATDMQKIKMQIVWRNTFVESEEVHIKGVSLDFLIDEAASK